MDIRGYFWRVFRDFQGILQSSDELQKSLEIYGDYLGYLDFFGIFLDTSMEIQKVTESFRDFWRFFESFLRVS